MQRNFIEEIKHLYQTGGMHLKLLFFNAGVFLILGLGSVFSGLFSPYASLQFTEIGMFLFGLKTDLFGFITHPWALFTSIFTHFSFWHFAMNMLFLFFAGRAFEQFFSAQRLLYTYILGGIAGGILEIFAHTVFPAVAVQQSVVIGASGSVMAIFLALAFHRPQLQVQLFGIFPIRLIFLALFFLLSDLFQLGKADGVAHFAHLGGALFGIWSVQKLHAANNPVNWVIAKFKGFSFSSKPKMKVQKNPRFKTDEEYNAEKKVNQEEIDRILDKIARSGYDALSKHEKEILFRQSKK